MLVTMTDRGMRGLHYHGGMIASPMRMALDVGVFDQVTTGVALGDADFYAALPDHATIRYLPAGQTHDHARLAAIPRLTAVNSVIEIDLFGQANAEWSAGRQISGQGGLVDFLRGARAAPGGRAVIALPATARGGTISRIVPRLAAGTPISIARAAVQYVATEYEMADLSDTDTDTDTRAARLIALAAPPFRAGLAAGWAAMRGGR